MIEKCWGMKPNPDKALMIAKRQLAELVYDAVNLEGLHFSLPEIQTLIDGITVGGHKLSDQQVAINQAEAWRKLFEWVCAVVRYRSESGLVVRGSKKAGAKKILGEKI